jgi:hypothetical protein
MSDVPPDDDNDDQLPLSGWTRRVSVTHDGRPIGYTEPLSDDYPFHSRLGPRFTTAQSRAAFKATTARGRQKGNLRSRFLSALKRGV